MWVDLWEVEATRYAWRRIGELFVEKSLITESELEQALAVQAASGRPLGQVLVSEDLVSSPEMTDVLVEQLGRKVAKEEGFESGLWSEIRRQTSRLLATKVESADELYRRISHLTHHLTDTQLALDQERAAHESARAEAATVTEELGTAQRRIGELAAIVDRLEAERDERFYTHAKRRRTITRMLFGGALHLAQE